MVAASSDYKARIRLALARPRLTACLKVLFCGEEFHDGFNFTQQALAGDRDVHVLCCSRAHVAQHIGDADMAARARLLREE